MSVFGLVLLALVGVGLVGTGLPAAFVVMTGAVAGAIVAARAQLGDMCIVNHRASVDHECVLAPGVMVAPGATLCGSVRVGEDAFIGAGATVLPRLSVGAGAMVGAGAVVTRDVAPGAVVCGNPARRVKEVHH